MPTDAHQPAPAHDLAAEKTVLRAMLRSPKALTEIVETLTEDDFYRPAHALIYTAALAVYANDQDPDPGAVTDELTRRGQMADAGGETYLTTLAGGPTGGPTWLKNAERIRALAVLRRIKQAAAHVEDLADQGTAESVERVVDAAQAEMFAATALRRSSIPPDRLLGDVFEDALDEIEAIGSKRADLVGVATGFHDLDVLTGGLHPGQLIVLAARPAMGCSTLVLDFLRAAAVRRNLPAALFTLESHRVEVAMRLLAAEAAVALHRMRAGTMDDNDWGRLARRVPEVTRAPLFLQDDAYASFTDLRAHCRRLRARHGVQLIAVDDLQLLNFGTRQLGSRYEEISEIARCLKLLAKELAIPIIAVSRVNRGPEQRTDRKPLLSDLRDSGALEDNADLVILLHREDAYDRESPRAGEADLIVAKHRYGPTATITVAHQGHYGRFVDIIQG